MTTTSEPLWKGFDAEFPPDTVPRGCSVTMGYIGGNALNVWKPALWLPFAHTRQLPLWGCRFDRNPGNEAAEAVAAMRKLGWHVGRALLGDTEINVDRTWWLGFETSVRAYGYRAVDYGSVDVVTENHAQEYLGALWDGVPSLDNLPELPPGERWLGKQYEAEVPYGDTKVDYSVVTHTLYRMGGVDARQQP